MRRVGVSGTRQIAGAVYPVTVVAASIAMMLLGYLRWGAVIAGALGALLWYPIDRVILAAIPDSRQRRDQDLP